MGAVTGPVVKAKNVGLHGRHSLGGGGRYGRHEIDVPVSRLHAQALKNILRKARAVAQLRCRVDTGEALPRNQKRSRGGQHDHQADNHGDHQLDQRQARLRAGQPGLEWRTGY